jgi:hypothetical protein
MTDPIEIAIAVQQAYGAALRPDVGYLIVDRTRLILWMDSTCCDILSTTPADAAGNSLMRLLPDDMKPRHDRLVDGVFEGFDRAIATQQPVTGLRSMRKVGPDGTTPPAKAFDWKGKPIELFIDFAPLVINGKLYAVAFLFLSSKIAEPLKVGELNDEIRKGSEILIQNSQIRILGDLATVADRVGNIIERQYTGLFGFYVKQVFGDSRIGRIASWLFSGLSWIALASALAAFILTGARIIFAKPSYTNITAPLSQPTLEPPSPDSNQKP